MRTGITQFEWSLQAAWAVTVAVTCLACAWARAAAPPPVICKDGTQSAATGRGACSSHGGVNQSAADKAANHTPMAEPGAIDATTAAKPDNKVAKPLTQAPPATTGDTATPEVAATGATTNSAVNAVRKPTTAVNPGAADGATAKCGDGSYSKAKSKQGACSRHGGVAQWMGPT